MTSKSDKELILAPSGNGAVTGQEEELLPALDDMTPREIVLELDKYIVGQAAAKRAVAVAQEPILCRPCWSFLVPHVSSLARNFSS